MKESNASGSSETDPSSIAELDLALINALQIHSRASWALIGQVLDISAVTAARRWDRLASEGVAWITAYGGPAMWEHNCLAFVEVDCEAASTSAVAAAMAADPYAASVEYTAGGANLFVTTAISNLTALSAYVRDRVSMLDGVIATRVHLATRVYTEASRWRLRALTEEQQATLTQDVATPGSEGILRKEDQPLLIALGVDGRRSHAQLADDLGVSASTVRRRLQQMIRADVVRFRCDVANMYTQWPVLVSYQAVCSPSQIDVVGRALASLREVRVCVAALGANNILFTVWLRSASSSLALELELSKRLPQMTITNRAVTLHSVKRFGRLLDDHGRSVGVVPMDIWHKLE
jgi:DNA-binding Lrp family transcriptional regulator